MATWVEKMAWTEFCPVCSAEVGEPCRSVQADHRELEFNHSVRNVRFHLRRDVQRGAGHEDDDGPS